MLCKDLVHQSVLKMWLYGKTRTNQRNALHQMPTLIHRTQPEGTCHQQLPRMPGNERPGQAASSKRPARASSYSSSFTWSSATSSRRFARFARSVMLKPFFGFSAGVSCASSSSSSCSSLAASSLASLSSLR